MGFEYETMQKYLVCPECHSELIRDGESLVCTNSEVRLKYEIVDGIPRMLVDEATKLSVEDWSGIMQRAGRNPETGAVIDAAEA